VPPAHGNWGDALPTVHRWAYDYSVPGAKQDFIPQHVAEENVEYEAGGRRVGEGE